MKFTFKLFVFGLLSAPIISSGMTISMPMKFISIAPGFYVDQYFKMAMDGRVASIIRVPLASSTLLFSDIELPQLENEVIRKVFLRPLSALASFDLSRHRLHSSRSKTERSSPFIVSDHVHLGQPHEALEKYFASISRSGIEELDFVVQTANSNEYTLTFNSLADVQDFLGLSRTVSKAQEFPILCVNTLSAAVLQATYKSPPYLRLVK